MSFITTRNSISIGLGGIISFFGARNEEQAQYNLLTESGNHIVQENYFLILLE